MKSIKLFVLAALLIVVSPARAQYHYPNTNPPANVTLAWNANTSIDPPVAGYNIYFGASGSRLYTNVISVGSSTTVTLSNLVRGATYYFAATAVAQGGIESDFSNEVTYRPATKPQAPVLQLAMSPDGHLVLGQGEAYGLFGIERTVDFSGWQSVGTARADRDGKFAFADAEFKPVAFYRAGHI